MLASSEHPEYWLRGDNLQILKDTETSNSLFRIPIMNKIQHKIIFKFVLERHIEVTHNIGRGFRRLRSKRVQNWCLIKIRYRKRVGITFTE